MFLHVEDLEGEAGKARLEAVSKLGDLPVLLFSGYGHARLAGTSSTVRFATVAGRGSQAVRYDGRVALLQKRAANPFAGMITIGRASNNDVVLELSTVSKFHGYFMRQADGWIYTDAKSTNGSAMNGVPMAPGQLNKVGSGDRLTFGTELEALFLTPEALESWIKKPLVTAS